MERKQHATRIFFRTLRSRKCWHRSLVAIVLLFSFANVLYFLLIPSTLTGDAVDFENAIQYEHAVEAYRQKVELAMSSTASRNCSRRNVNVDLALSCLQMTTPSLELIYPTDAEFHFNEIRLAMAPWAQHGSHKMHRFSGYSGPWIENVWISHFEGLYDNAISSSERQEFCLDDIFGPFIPIFVPWVDLWVNNLARYPEGLVRTLHSVLRPTVPYIVVSQNDDGLPGNDIGLKMSHIPNVLVLSAGGYGHVAVPLLKQSEPLNNQKQIKNRRYLLSYVGSLVNAPRDMRLEMDSRLKNMSRSNQLTPFRYMYYKGKDWRNVMADSRFSLVPRGYGRTSYHVMETLQMGLIPIQVYTDVPWIPYPELFEKVGFVTNLNGLEALVDRLQHMTIDEIQQRENTIESLRNSHFSFEGAMSQIQLFLNGNNESSLQCRQLPNTTRDQ